MSTETKTPLLPGAPELLSAVFDHYPTDADATHTPWTVALVNTIAAGFWKNYGGILTYVDMCRLEVTCAAGAVSKVVNLRPTGLAAWDTASWTASGAASTWQCVLGDNPNNFIWYITDGDAVAFRFETLPADINSVSSVKLVASVASGEPSGNNSLSFMIANDTSVPADSLAIDYIEVSNVAEYNEWSTYDPLALGVVKAEAVSDADDATGVSVTDASSLNKIQVFRFGKMSADSPQISLVQLKVYGVVVDATPGYHAECKAWWIVGGASATSSFPQAMDEVGVTLTFNLDNPLGGSWTTSEVNALCVGLVASRISQCTMVAKDLELIITYTSGGSTGLKLMNGMTQSQLT
jgi:hypothetical protein